MSDKMRVFVASSSEQVHIVEKLVTLLTELDKSHSLELRPWNEGVFELSSAYIESLEEELFRADFAIVILTADDSAKERQKDVNLPRDNVIFELGLFTGRLGRNRCYFFVDRDSETKIASDLAGVGPAYYSLKGDKRLSLRKKAHDALEQMLALGERYKPSPQDRQAQEGLWRFSCRLQGAWWERIRRSEDDSSALSFVTLAVDPVTNTPRITRPTYSYGLDGEALAEWWSVSTGVMLPKPGRRPELYYRWKGNHLDVPGQEFGGGASITFDDDRLDSGRGEFYDTNYALIGQQVTTRIKHFRLYRATPEAANLMKNDTTREAKELIVSKLDELHGR